MRQILFWLATLLCAVASEACEERAPAARALERLRTVMAEDRFVAYHPTSLELVDGRWTEANEASVYEDLRVLRPRFDGLITYGSAHGADRVADVAAALGYRALILGVWSIDDANELARAIAAAARQPDLVVGLSIGNERVFAGTATPQEVIAAIARARARAPSLAVTSTEPFHLYLDRDVAPLITASDFMLVNVHPIFERWFPDATDSQSAEFVVNVVDRLAAHACGPILVKETGVPTAPEANGFTPERQAGFYAALRSRLYNNRSRSFAYFSAFDAPWRVHDAMVVPGEHPEEAHWGLYDAHRNPKRAVADIPLLSPGGRRP
jgi:exo-beta-1,3-glucanase (GH17 family)